MAQVITAFECYGQEMDEPVTKRWRQFMSMTMTGANTDTAYDFSSITAGALGTFWTAAGGSTAGALALAAMRAIKQKQKAFLGIRGTIPEVKTRLGASNQTLNGTVAAGSATPAVTVTGLLTTDVILAVTQTTKGANNLPLLAWNSQIADGFTAVYSADPGANAVLEVDFLRVAGTETPQKGQFLETISSGLPSMTFASGDAPTSWTLYFEWDLNDYERALKYPTP